MGLKSCPDWTRRQYGPAGNGSYRPTIPSVRFRHVIVLVGNRGRRFFVQRMF
jgi:hypothetical protein